MRVQLRKENKTMTFDTETIEMLRQPLDAALIKHRPGSKGMMLKYLSGHDVVAAANRVFGPGAWGYTVVARSHDIITDGKKGPVDIYTCDIELHVQGAAFPFPGDGVGIVNAPYTAESHEQARKTATTDALKRALRHYGAQFGLSLYSEDEYVLDEGALVQVKDVHPGNHNGDPKRIVEATGQTAYNRQQIASPTRESKVSAPSGKTATRGAGYEYAPSGEQVNGKNGQPPKETLNTIYLKARDAKLFTTSKGNEQADFLTWVGSLFPDRTVAASADISQEMREYLEAQVSQEAPHA